MKILLSLMVFGSLTLAPCVAAPTVEADTHTLEEPGAVYFTPPEGWRLAEAAQLPPSVKVMVVGQGEYAFAPSINLAEEPFRGTLKQYLKLVKAINESQGSSWQDLGTLRTQAGNANLSQTAIKTQWGEARMLHVMLVKNQKAYILTAAALRDEFPKFYKDFFNALRSLHINKSAQEMLSTPKKRADLEQTMAMVKDKWSASMAQGGQGANEDAFSMPEDFQESTWRPFGEALEQNYKEMSPIWREQVKQQLLQELAASGHNRSGKT